MKHISLLKTSFDMTQITEIVTDTPQLAAEWLDKNVRNRTVSEKTVRRYTADMRAGAWLLTGDAIRFDEHGNLLDGQHRLIACVKANASFQTLVVYGLNADAQSVMDTGKSRSAGDALSLKGVTYAKNVAAIARVILVYKSGFNMAANVDYTHSRIFSVVEAHPGLERSANATFSIPPRLPRPTIGFLHYVASNILDEQSAAEEMMTVLKTGVPSYQGDAMHKLRERFFSMADAGRRVTREVASWTAVSAWNHFVKRRPVQAIRWQRQPVKIDGLKVSQL